MILRWSPFKIVSVSAFLYPRWPPLLKIEISSNGQSCSILSQKVPKFELYKHNDELFSSHDPKGHVSYSHHLASVVVVRRKLFQKSSPLKVLDQWKPNLVWIITRVSSFKIVSGDAVHQPTWPPLLKIEISSNDQKCSILSQKVPKFELYKHNDELFNIYYGIFYELWTFTEFDRLWN